jgi:hypothetical protein
MDEGERDLLAGLAGGATPPRWPRWNDLRCAAIGSAWARQAGDIAVGGAEHWALDGEVSR